MRLHSHSSRGPSNKGWGSGRPLKSRHGRVRTRFGDVSAPISMSTVLVGPKQDLSIFGARVKGR